MQRYRRGSFSPGGAQKYRNAVKVDAWRCFGAILLSGRDQRAVSLASGPEPCVDQSGRTGCGWQPLCLLGCWFSAPEKRQDPSETRRLPLPERSITRPRSPRRPELQGLRHRLTRRRYEPKPGDGGEPPPRERAKRPSCVWRSSPRRNCGPWRNS